MLSGRPRRLEELHRKRKRAAAAVGHREHVELLFVEHLECRLRRDVAEVQCDARFTQILLENREEAFGLREP